MGDAPAARHALRALTLLARQAGPTPAASIARELGLPRSTTYRVLGVLVEEGFAVHLAGEHRYGLGVSAYELGFAYSRQEPLQWLARPVLQKLVDETGHSGHFAVLHGPDVLYVVEERAPGRPSLVTDVGVRLPAHLTASGLAMLAALSGSQLRALYPPGRALITRHGGSPESFTELRRRAREARELGYAVEDGTVTPGLASVGCAVLDHTGRPAAAVALTFPPQELTDEGVAPLATLVRATAGEIGRRLVGRSGS